MKLFYLALRRLSSYLRNQAHLNMKFKILNLKISHTGPHQRRKMVPKVALSEINECLNKAKGDTYTQAMTQSGSHTDTHFYHEGRKREAEENP